MSTYSELLKDPRWQRKRLEILSRSNFTCERCEASTKTLHVHHKIYRKGAKPWEYDNHELIALCEDCHEVMTHVQDRLKEAMAELDDDGLEELLGYADGLVAKRYSIGSDENPPPRAWNLTGFSHAYGFSIAVTRVINSMSVYRIIDLCPIDVEKVRALTSSGEPIPEQDIDAECEFLGMLFSGPAAWEVLARNKEMILEDDFYDATHRKVYRAMIDLLVRQEPVTAQAVNRLLGKTGPVDPHDYVEWLSTCAPPDANVHFLSQRIRAASPVRSHIRKQG